MLYYNAESIEDAAEITANGGAVFEPKTAIDEHGWRCLVRDVEGNIIGLFELAKH